MPTDHPLPEHTRKCLRWVVEAFASSQNGVMITDAEGTVIDVNPAFTAVTGFAREEIVGKTPRLLHSDLQEPSFYETMWCALREKGAWQGEITNRRKSGELVVELLSINAVRDENGLASHYIGIFADITHFKDYQRQLERMAHFDPLTQLPNRVLLEDRIAQGIAWVERQGSLLAVCYLDLDGFKPINDQHGHHTGDMVLIEIAERLRLAIREGDTVARLGGDEFVLLLVDIDTVAEAECTMERLLAAVAEPLAGNPSIRLSASAGISIYPVDDSEPDILLRHPDHALYQAKESGRSTYRLYDPEQDRRARNARESVTALRRAMESGELHLYYQPKVDLENRRVTGFEALIRWLHPQRGLLLPGQFLPGITDAALAIELDLWVVSEALRQAAAWHDQGIALPISVNVSSPLLEWSGFEKNLRRLLLEAPGLPPGSLELEILESFALDDLLLVGQLIEVCQSFGVSFALDDFGTGYSSLAYLKRLPARVLKIDRSFVADMLTDKGDMAIVEGIIGLASAFGREVVAEGVETPEQARELLRLGCRIAQGFGIASPMPAASVHMWLENFYLDGNVRPFLLQPMK